MWHHTDRWDSSLRQLPAASDNMAELGWHRTMSSGSRSTTTAPMTPLSQIMESELEPCASTASLFLYSQGSVILSLHHDTLAVDRRFTRHQEKISFIRVDNVSERGAGRLVVSYDFSQTAIVWDLFTGTEISRFASFEPLRVAAWMRNGNVAFGNDPRKLTVEWQRLTMIQAMARAK